MVSLSNHEWIAVRVNIHRSERRSTLRQAQGERRDVVVRLRDENDHGPSAVPSFDRLRTNGIEGLDICEVDGLIKRNQFAVK